MYKNARNMNWPENIISSAERESWRTETNFSQNGEILLRCAEATMREGITHSPATAYFTNHSCSYYIS